MKIENFPRLDKFLKYKISLVVLGLYVTNPLLAQLPKYSVPENNTGTHYMLGIVGYNYTDSLIANYTVDGQGGGDIRLSSPTSGGGSTVCCIMLSKKPHWPIYVLVRWQDGGCRENTKDHKFVGNHYQYKEATVSVDRGTSSNPSDIAVHFYQDGSVKVRLSDGDDPPLVKRPDNRPDKFKLPDCRPGEAESYS